MKFDKELELDEDGNVYEYIEKDIFEQIRKMIENKFFIYGGNEHCLHK
ncbi:hypothetical protein [Clostridium sp. OS1-26]|nr:hypothetical protein [Clostridium sp. OS1-26]WML34660.1 hypothetical protein RCG18_25920 [Clostridium sp. OS1-26]